MQAQPLETRGLTIVSFNVPALHDPADARAVRAALEPVEGVERVVVNLAPRLVQVRYYRGKTDPVRLKQAIEAVGYPVQRYSDGFR